MSKTKPYGADRCINCGEYGAHFVPPSMGEPGFFHCKRKEEKRMPQAVWEGAFTIFGVKLKCYVLDDGRRILDADDVAALFDAMGDPKTEEECVAFAGEIDRLAMWIKGVERGRD